MTTPNSKTKRDRKAWEKRSIALNEYLRKYSSHFPLRSILMSQEVTKGQIWRLDIFRECAIISEPIIRRMPQKKAIDSSFTCLSLTSHRNWQSFNRLGYSTEVKKCQNKAFSKTFFLQINFEVRMLVTKFWPRHIPLVETRRNMYILTLKGQCQNFSSGQCHMRPRAEPSRSYCTSVGASSR